MQTIERENSIRALPLPTDVNDSDNFDNIIISIPQQQQQQQQPPLPLEDISPINSFASFFSEFKNESSKLWRLAAPAILTTVFQYSLGAITQTFAGHVGQLDLAAFSIENSVIGGLSYGIMVRTLEVWYFTALILFAGYLKNAEVAVDSLSICVNILGWTGMVALGFNAAVSVRVSNELGADRPRTAKFAVFVVVISSFVIALLISVFFLAFQKQYPTLFSNTLDVRNLVYHLTPMLAFCIVLNNVQPALSGVAIGAGWQAIVAYVNIGSYYLFGIPLGLTLGYAVKWGVRGIWYGMAGGTAIQTLILLWLIYRTNWKKEASAAAERINTWGGESAVRENNIEN
ncbi:MATE efflux family protein [Striga asiatica]|uniref:MATE efflux family protein n=1 Tax=Striga asiatica TaxID=4170 RepID=A0A5A7Q237_STRAF|nr:MATE efflux family protein [Striga asiatica]